MANKRCLIAHMASWPGVIIVEVTTAHQDTRIDGSAIEEPAEQPCLTQSLRRLRRARDAPVPRRTKTEITGSRYERDHH